MNLNEAYDALKAANINIPYIKFSMNLGTGICDSILIRVSLDAEKDWANGIFQNSRWGNFHIFCLNQREKENDVYTLSFNNHTGIKMRQMNNVSIDKIVKYLIEKLNQK